MLTLATLEYPNRERHPLPMSATAAFLTCVARINFFKPSASVHSFAFGDVEKLTPRCITDPHRERVVRNHPAHIERLNREGVKSLDQIVTDFVVKIFARVRDALMFERDQATRTAAVGTPLLLTRKSALRSLQLLLRVAQWARILNLLAVRERGETRQADINADAVPSDEQGVRLN